MARIDTLKLLLVSSSLEFPSSYVPEWELRTRTLSKIIIGRETRKCNTISSGLMRLYQYMQAVRGAYKAERLQNKYHLRLKPLTGESIMRRAQVEVFLLSVAIATALATSYEKTGDCGVSIKVLYIL